MFSSTLALKEVFFRNVFFVCIFSDIPSVGFLYVPISCNAPAKKVVCGGRSACHSYYGKGEGKEMATLISSSLSPPSPGLR